jgi:hypothetical protein
MVIMMIMAMIVPGKLSGGGKGISQSSMEEKKGY